MQHPRTVVNPAQRFVTWKYPEYLPREPFFMVYHPCECGHEVTVEAITVERYLTHGLYGLLHHRAEFNNHWNQALADHLAQNYQYPPAPRPTYVHNNLRNEDEDEEYNTETHYENHRADWTPQNHPPRRPNLLGPVLENWLVYPEYEPEDESTDDRRDYDSTSTYNEYYSKDGYDSTEDDEAER